MKQLRIYLALLFSLASLGIGQNTLLHTTVISSGGGIAVSPSYRFSNTIAQPLTGLTPSTSNKIGLGFWYQYNSLRQYYAASFTLNNGWNMVSVPKVVADYRKQTLFPGATSEAFAYEVTYKTKDTLHNGIGYWLKFNGSQAVSYSGLPMTNDSVEISNRWNMIGSVSKTVPVNAITQVPPGSVTTQYFGYNGMYTIATSIEPGKAYWVKSKNAGRLVLNAPGALAAVQLADAKLTSKDNLNILKVQPSGTNKSDQHQELLFGNTQMEKESLEQFELPPTPPKGIIDARFAANRFLEILPEQITEPKEIPLHLQSNGEALRLSWSMKENQGVKYFLIEKKGTQVIAKHKMKDGGSLSLDVNEEYNYFLRAEKIPLQFGLLQNYPNPFNPTTTIRYDLPTTAYVTLKIYNVLGQQVLTAIDNQLIEDGQQAVEINASNLASGAYFYRLEAKTVGKVTQFQSVKKMLMIK